jgi:beta-glucanase (GH16 family)
MKRFLPALLLACFVTLARAEDAPPLPAPIAGQDYHLVKDWDFATNILDTTALRQQFYTRYASNNGTLDHLGQELEVYRDNDNHEISDGVLHLIARDPSGALTAGAIESGMIRSKWTGKYGYYEAKIKVPKGRGMWPAFWFSSEVWPPEIDAVEVVNDGNVDTTVSYHSLHGLFIGKTLSTKLDKWNSYHAGVDFAAGFHIFAIEWTPTIVRHYVDNVLVAEREFQWRQDNGAPAPSTPVVLNLAVGGPWAKAPTSASEFPASLDVAYVRVWQK